MVNIAPFLSFFFLFDSNFHEMEILRIKSVKEDYADELLDLYLDIFPETQRHVREDFEALLEKEDIFFANVVLMNGSVIGFFNYWNLDEFVYLEHLAVEPPMRGHKLGEKLVDLLKKSIVDKPIILEVERAEDSEFGERRIEFYRRLGFELLPFDYKQPPYRPDGDWISLHLMSNNLALASDRFDEFVSILYSRVYKQ